jgi:hypothetical protein
MRLIVLIITFLLSAFLCFGKQPGQYFQGGLQYGLSANTIYRYSSDLSYFDELNSGKKITASFGLFVNRHLGDHLQIETGLLYHKRGTRYREHFQSGRKIYGYKTFGVDLHYLSFPFVINLRKDGKHQPIFRFGLDVGYLFSTNIPHAVNNTDLYMNEFDIEGIVGYKWKPERVKFFHNKEIVLDLRCSFLPIIKPGTAHLIGGDAGFDILPEQRNISLTFSIQHLFE